MPWDVRKNAIAKFTEALVAALQEGRAPFDAIRVSSAAHLGIAGRADTVARISLALAQDFEREAGVSIVRDAVVLSRIAQAYLLALEGSRTSDLFDLNLPFITATPKGPVHLQRRLTAKLLSELRCASLASTARAPHRRRRVGPRPHRRRRLVAFLVTGNEVRAGTGWHCARAFGAVLRMIERGSRVDGPKMSPSRRARPMLEGRVMTLSSLGLLRSPWSLSRRVRWQRR